MKTRSTSRSRGVIYAAIIIIILLVSGTAGLLINNSSGQGRRNLDERPRNLDLWSFNPDGTMRFTTLHYPDVASGVDAQMVEAAGPLLFSEDDILSAQVIGGDELGASQFPSQDYIDNAGRTITIYYDVYQIAYDPSSGPYGVDVMTENSPYLNPDTASGLDEAQVISLGADPQTHYKQIVVAVALPHDTRILSIDNLQPYRQVSIGRWDVYYFDATSTAEGDSILISYLPRAIESPPPLDVMRVDRRR